MWISLASSIRATVLALDSTVRIAIWRSPSVA
jgi:hypothetical protein